MPHVSSEHRAAGIITRGVAGAIDSIVVFLCAVVVVLTFRGAQFVWSPMTFTWNDVSIWGSISLLIAIAIIYLTFAWAMIGRSYGQYLLGLRVLSRKRLKPGWALALLRAVFCVLFPIGVFWVALSPHRRSVQDIVLRTIVVYDWGTVELSHDVPPAD
jgi:uncharacterized RDD family membrane protein YckC